MNAPLNTKQMEALRILFDLGEWVTATRMNGFARSTGDALVRRNLAERRLEGIGTIEWAKYRITLAGRAVVEGEQ